MGLRCTSLINAFDEIDRTWATYTCHESYSAGLHVRRVQRTVLKRTAYFTSGQCERLPIDRISHHLLQIKQTYLILKALDQSFQDH